MGNCGKPEQHLKRLGLKVARCRTREELSRAKLVERLLHLHYSLPPDDPEEKLNISEGLIRNIEEGKKVKVSRRLIELLCIALKLTSTERLQLLAIADRNPLADKNGQMDGVSDFLLQTVIDIRDNPKGKILFDQMLNDKRAESFTREERIDILLRILDFLKNQPKK